MNGPNKKHWLNAIEKEIQSIHEKETWVLVDPPPGSNILGCKWVFKEKPDPISPEEKIYKARLVAQGYNQKPGVDYNLTYEPVIRFSAIRMLFAYAAKMSLDIFHLNVDSA